MRNTFLAGVVAVLTGAVAFAVGRATAPRPAGGAAGGPAAEAAGLASARGAAGEAAVLRQRLALAESKLQQAAAREQVNVARHVKRAAAAAAGPDARPSEPPAHGEDAGPVGPGASVSELVQAIEGMAASKELFRPEVLDHVQGRLVAELLANPSALAAVLERFRACAGTDAGAMLAVALGQLKDPQVETLALDLARGGRSEGERLAGLELLDRLDIENPATRGAVLDLLRGEERPAVLGAALYALHRGVPEPAESRRAVAALAPLAANADAEVRRRAVVALGAWAADAASLQPVVAALLDPSADVRAGAAFALGQTRVAHPGLVEALVARVSDGREDWSVREVAWQSLTRFPLDERAWSRVAEFRAQREAAGEVADPKAEHGE